MRTAPTHKWLVTLAKGGQVLAFQSIVLRGTESILCDLSVKCSPKDGSL